MKQDEILQNCYDSTLNYEQQLKPLFLFVERMFANESHIEVDALLQNFDPTLANNTICLGILRVSSRAKNLMPNWFICRDKVKTHLESQDLEIKQLMRGLL